MNQMKKAKLFLLFLLVVLAAHVKAQVNYLFSANSIPYVPVSGGITPHLLSDYPGVWELTDEGFATVPIGFDFVYNMENYTQANVCVNGFITLGGTLDIFYNYPYYKNTIAWAPPYNKRPIIAPLWDDLVLSDTSMLVYKTTGTAPFRVFTIEWKQAKWGYLAAGPVLSIELKLFETTNIIEFHYKDEGTLPRPNEAFASIGITSAWANRDFISLQNTSAQPSISFMKPNDSLSVKPANDQVYRFSPALIPIPNPFELNLKYTNKKVSFELHASGVSNFEYAITQSPIAPASGSKTSSPNVTKSGLTPSTTYYLYARSKSINSLYSQWTCYSFKTAVDPMSLPYSEDFGANPNMAYFPPSMRQQDFNDTSYYYAREYTFSTAGVFPNDGNSMFYFNFIDFYDVNAWAFTPGFHLNSGKTYQLKFSFASYWEYDPSDAASLEVKFGTACSAAGMTSGTLFSKNDITNYNELEDTIISFIPPSSGVYYFGFHDKSLFLGAALLVDNISLMKMPLLKMADMDSESCDYSSSIFPNPTSNFSTLSFNLQKTSQVHVKLFDILGNVVLNVCDKNFDAGINSIEIETAGLKSGIYFCVIEAEGIYETKKLLKN